MDSKQTSLIKANEHWVNTKWRPALGWSYIAICLFDFIVGPLVNYAFFKITGAAFDSWKPLTMSDGGMFHLSMGAVLGITSWTRGQEKMINRTKYERDDPYEYRQTDRASYRDRVLSENSAGETRSQPE